MGDHDMRLSRANPLWGGRALSVALLALAGSLRAAEDAGRPNFVLCMSDDQGWGDTGYNGHPELETHTLDSMASSGLRLNRFYAAAPYCSPTRGSLMTGRHPYRYGCFAPNWSFRPEEVTLAETLRAAGYVTGHFGKWHLGPVKASSPVSPIQSGFDECLSHDNWFDMSPPLSRNGHMPEPFRGESSRVVSHAAEDFITEAVKAGKPFLAVVWFPSPHSPHLASLEDRKRFGNAYYAEIGRMDAAIGWLRRRLGELGVADNTLLFFCSDNGAAGPGSTGGLRGKKGSLWEGGIRVPAVLEWPARIKQPVATDVPCSTSDLYPTILDILDLEPPERRRPLDGISLLPLIDGTMQQRPKPIAFWHAPGEFRADNEPYLDRAALTGWWRTFRNVRHPQPRTEGFSGHAALIDGRFKLHHVERRYELYDVVTDPSESKNLAEQHPHVVADMKATLQAWQKSVEQSLAGDDY